MKHMNKIIHNGREVASLEVTRYILDDEGGIKITHLKGLDENGKYIGFLNHKNVIDKISQYHITWKPCK